MYKSEDEDEEDTGAETELTDADDLPVDVPKRVIVPRRVKHVVKKIKEVDATIRQIKTQDPAPRSRDYYAMMLNKLA